VSGTLLRITSTIRFDSLNTEKHRGRCNVDTARITAGPLTLLSVYGIVNHNQEREKI